MSYDHHHSFFFSLSNIGNRNPLWLMYLFFLFKFQSSFYSSNPGMIKNSLYIPRVRIFLSLFREQFPLRTLSSLFFSAECIWKMDSINDVRNRKNGVFKKLKGFLSFLVLSHRDQLNPITNVDCPVRVLFVWNRKQSSVLSSFRIDRYCK